MKKDSFVSIMDSLEAPTIKLATLIREDQLDLAPIPATMILRNLLFHLAGVGDTAQAVVSGQWKMEAPDWEAAKSMSKETLIDKIRSGHACVRQAYEGISQEAFESRATHTPWGAKGTIEELSVSVLYNHQVHHKMQLFMDLKALGIEVDTGTLYMGLDPGAVKT